MTTFSQKLNAARNAMQQVNARGRKADEATALCQKLLDPSPSYTSAQEHIDRMKLSALCLDLGTRMADPRGTMLVVGMCAMRNSPAVALFKGVKTFCAPMKKAA